MHSTIRPLPLLLLAATLAAQTAPPRGPDSSTRTTTPGVEVLAYPNLPFSATDTIVRSQPMDGGGTVTTSETSKVFRDSQGRVYRERHRFAPQGADPDHTLFEFYILDPVAHTRTACTIATRDCTLTTFYPQLNFGLRPTGPFDNGKQFLARESLGQQSIDDLTAIGTRETTTISPGAIGNDLALTLTREFWYATDLKTNLIVTRSDPREGTVNIHLKILSRSDPDPSVFAIPLTTRSTMPALPPPHA
jgi:hypothetical protein